MNYFNYRKKALYKKTQVPTIEVISPKSNINIIYNTDLDISYKKFLVLSLVRNCSFTINYINNFIKDFNAYTDKVKFCFFTNNNSDRSKVLLNRLADKYNPTILIIDHNDEHINLYNRIAKFSAYRNLNFDNAINHFGIDFDYVIVFDSDLYEDIPIKPIIDSIKINNTWSCISGNHCYNKSDFYYDELALRFLDDPIDIKQKFTNFKKYYGISEYWINNLWNFQDYMEVRSAFGGISIYNMDELYKIYSKNNKLYEINNLPEFTTEHTSLCLKLKESIIINPFIKYSGLSNINNKFNIKV